MPTVALVVFTRDLRVRDHPALVTASRDADQIVPLFVLDDELLASNPHRYPNRLGFVLDALSDLDRSLRALGAALVIRRGRWVDEVLRVASTTRAETIHVSDDVSGFATRRLARLEHEAATVRVVVRRHPGIMVVPPEAIVPSSARAGDDGRAREMKVFTPYYDRWRALPLRPIVATPKRIVLPAGLDPGDAESIGRLPDLHELSTAPRSPDVVRGGESAGLAQLKRWAREGLAGYDDGHDDLAGDRTSRISPFLHLGCLSPVEVVQRLRDRPGGPGFIRQLCWRDFFHQVLAARPDAAHGDYRPRGDRWVRDDDAAEAWIAGRTGYPIVDAGMRQLRREGWMHNRARMVVASFLTKDLYLDWRIGAAHFLELLVDGDVANNQLNWQWVAGTGNDRNSFRVFNPLRQAERFDPRGEYVRRYVDELAGMAGSQVHDPSPEQRRAVGYPEPIVDHAAAVAAYKNRDR